MGTALRPIADHQIGFDNRVIQEVAQEIEQILNQVKLPNPDFLRSCANEWYVDRPDMQEAINRLYWIWVEDGSFNYARDHVLEFEGPYALTVTVSKQYLEFWNPPFRYCQWFCLQMRDGSDPSLYRDKWRTYYQQVVHAFGGNRLLYTADNTHPLEKYSSLDGGFSAMEKALYDDMGPAKKTFAEVCLDDRNSYFIDLFNDLA